MAVITDIANCNTNAALNTPTGADAPSELDDAIRNALAFIAQLRDGLGIPVGMLSQFPTATAPTGWIKANGALVSRTTYARLFAFATGSGLVSEATWSAGSFGLFSVGDGSSTFRLPDLRGMFLRGLDESRGIDASRAVGVDQASANTSHAHTPTDPGHAHSVSDSGHQHTGVTNVDPGHQHGYVRSNFNAQTNAGSQANFPTSEYNTATDPGGAHAHNFTTSLNAASIAIVGAATGITIQAQGIADGRPRNIAYPWFLKF